MKRYLYTEVWYKNPGFEKTRRIRHFHPFVEVQRMMLAFIIAVLGYALMLVAMTYIVAYLLAVCAGLAVGEFVFSCHYRVHLDEDCA